MEKYRATSTFRHHYYSFLMSHLFLANSRERVIKFSQNLEDFPILLWNQTIISSLVVTETEPCQGVLEV